MSDLVADTSVAIKWFVREVEAEIAETILVSGWRIHAPEFLRIETANALWKKWRKKEFPHDDVAVSVARLGGMIDEWHPDGTLIEDASAMSLALNHPVYDCVFMVLAQKLGAPIVSADKRLLGIAPKGLAVALADWRP